MKQNGSQPIGNESMETESLAFREIREIPKSPHLSKDFSPNGERLRSSIRFRRQERMQKQRSLRSLANMLSQQNSYDSGGENNTPIENNENSEQVPNYFNYPKLQFGYLNDVIATENIRKSKPYGEKGFIIQVNDGSLTLNDVKDLNNCYSDDFDSSCDTSLNYIDPESLNSSVDMEIDHQRENRSETPVRNVWASMPIDKVDSITPEIFHDPLGIQKYSLDEVRENLNKCKTKLDALEIVEMTKIPKKLSKSSKTKPSKLSLSNTLTNHDKLSPTKSETVDSKPISVFTRLHPVSSPILNSRSSNNPKKISNLDSPTKNVPSKRDQQPKSNGSTRNYSKNTMSFIEKMNDGPFDRRQHPPQNGKTDERKTIQSNKKLNNFGKSNQNSRTGYPSDQPMELLTTKPPAPILNKKRNDSNNKTPTNRNPNDKTKKSNNLHSSPTRKRL